MDLRTPKVLTDPNELSARGVLIGQKGRHETLEPQVLRAVVVVFSYVKRLFIFENFSLRDFVNCFRRSDVPEAEVRWWQSWTRTVAHAVDIQEALAADGLLERTVVQPVHPSDMQAAQAVATEKLSEDGEVTANKAIDGPDGGEDPRNETEGKEANKKIEGEPSSKVVEMANGDTKDDLSKQPTERGLIEQASEEMIKIRITPPNAPVKASVVLKTAQSFPKEGEVSVNELIERATLVPLEGNVFAIDDVETKRKFEAASQDLLKTVMRIMGTPKDQVCPHNMLDYIVIAAIFNIENAQKEWCTGYKPKNAAPLLVFTKD